MKSVEGNTKVKDDNMKVTITSIGDFSKTESWLAKVSSNQKPTSLIRLGEMGVRALESATPRDTGITASSWSYDVIKTGRGWDLVFYNSGHPESRIPVALLIQYGHGTKNGGYIPPIDFINPALKPILAQAGELLAREVG